MADLQVADYIALNMDRHSENMIYQFEGLETGEPKFKGVVGIDNDFGLLVCLRSIAFFAFLRWLYVKKEALPAKGKIALELTKMCLVCACALIQVLCIMQSSRTSNEWRLLARIVICLKGMVYAP